MDLRLHRPALATEEAGGGFRLHRREGDNAPRDGHTVALQQPLRLIFMNVHRSLSCSLTDYGILYTRANAPAMPMRSEEHTSELQSLMRISYAVFCLKKTT